MQTLDGAQRAIWLLAFAKEQKDIKSRVRIPADIEQRYQLRCQVPQPGSYLLPMFLDSAQPNLASWDQREAVLNDFESFASALHSQDRDSIATLLPDSGLRKRVVDAFLRIAPKPGSGWLLDLARNGTKLRLDDRWQRSVRKMFASANPEPDRETINGELMEIDFANRLITITPIGSNRRLQVTYPDSMEDLLFENRREIIQITGRVSRDENGDIKTLFDPESIGPLDLTPLELREVEFQGLRLRFRQTMLLQPKLVEDNPQFLAIEDAELGLDVFAGTIEELVEELSEDLTVLWLNYAKAADSDLTPQALEMKHRLLAALEEWPIAS